MATVPAPPHTRPGTGSVADAPPPTRPLRRDAEANRRHILEAAGRLMAERGLAAPLEDIAAAAGVGVATLYRRFPTRAALVEALFRDRLGAYVADLQAAAAMPDGWEGLLWFLRRSVSRQIADRALAELLEHDVGTDTIRQLIDRIWPLGEVLVERAKATGRLRPDFDVSDLVFLQQMLVAVGTALQPLRPTAWERYLAFVTDGIVAARTEPAPAAEAALSLQELLALHAMPPTLPRRQR